VGHGAISALGITLYKTPKALQDVTQDFCLIGDYFCTSIDGHNNAHHLYTNHTSMYQTADYIVDQLKKDGVRG
jgi:hypothetical protein